MSPRTFDVSSPGSPIGSVWPAHGGPPGSGQHSGNVLPLWRPANPHRPLAAWAWLWGPLAALVVGCIPDFSPYDPCPEACPSGQSCVEGVCVGARDVQGPEASRDDASVSPGCVDEDGDGFVSEGGCSLPSGDCAPDDAYRRPGASEICNGLDDDCDTAVDEDDPGGNEACVGDRVGVCASGRTVCSGGRIECVSVTLPSTERCNGVDDDCDGEVDEGNPSGGGRCATGMNGVCTLGTELCESGALVCQQTVEATSEICNGLDDDCDGQIDEGGVGGGGACDTGHPGICAFGSIRCVDAQLVCQPAQDALPEICNGVDDDCDGTTDELWADELLQPCSTGIGLCRRGGMLVCNVLGNDVTCDAEQVMGSAERCNGLDDDCDGETDEDFAVNAACTGGLGQCAQSGVWVCSDDQLQVVCNASPGNPGPEQCNGLDDNCNGEIDEAFPGLGTECAPDGPCATVGHVVCSADENGTECDADPRVPEPERCNDVDDDCDGEVDEGFEAKGGPCGVGVGTCAREALWTCDPEAGTLICPVVLGSPEAEICDGQDNDCDGRVDNGATCPNPPSGVVTHLAIAAADDEGCADLNGDGRPDNGLAPLAPLFNGPLQATLGDGRRIAVVRALDFPAGGAARSGTLEFLVGRPGRNGGGAAPEIEIDPRSIAPTGRARNALSPITSSQGQAVMLPSPHPFEFISPLFHDRYADLWPWSQTRWERAHLSGRFTLEDNGGVMIRSARLTGVFDRAAVVDAYRAANDICADFGDHAPLGCSIFDRAGPAQVEAHLVADLPPDGERERVSVCLEIEVDPSADILMPPIGGQACQAIDDCPAGLRCRPVPWTTQSHVGAALALRCGLATSGEGGTGDACQREQDCAAGLCVTADAGGAICSALCAHDDDCPAAMACRGMSLEVEGALGHGGASAMLCVPHEGSGAPCVANDCQAEEICGVWLVGDVGVPDGDVQIGGICQAPHPDGAGLGEICADAFDCVRGHRCVPDPDGVNRCLAPCRSTEHCASGYLCLDRDATGAVADVPALQHGFCVPVPADTGSGRACHGDRDCPGTETCHAHRLESSGIIDRYCRRGVGFFAVGQRCEDNADCASNRCVGGFCSGICDDHADCGTHLSCFPEGTLDPDTGAILGGACRPPDGECRVDNDCSAVLGCGNQRCVCAQRACRVGCHFPLGACPEGLFCKSDGTCSPYCRDDMGEPNDDLAGGDAPVLISLGRTQPWIQQQHRMCPESAIDWYRIENRGQPFHVDAIVDLDAADVELELALFDPDGDLIAMAEPDGGRGNTWTLEITDAPRAAEWLDSAVDLRIRAAGVFEAVTYDLRVELDYPNCPDPHAEPRDNNWDWTPFLTGPGRSAEDQVEGWICPDDTDWYSVYVGNDETLTVSFETLDLPDPDHDELQLELVGPGFQLEIPSQVRGSIRPHDAVRTLELMPSQMRCDADATPFPLCNYDDYGLSVESCLEPDIPQCFGGTWFLRVSGTGPLDRGRYRIDARVDRATVAVCINDPLEQNQDFDVPAFKMLAGAVDPTMLTEDEIVLPFGEHNIVTPAVPSDVDLVIPNLVSCDVDDLDHYVLFFPPNTTVSAELRRLDPEPHAFRLTLYNPITLEIFDESIGVQEVLRVGGYQTPADPPFYYLVGVMVIGAAQGGVRYSLTMRAESEDHDPDEGCDAPTRLTLDPNHTVTVEGTTTGARNDHTSHFCFGTGGPDRAYRVLPPGPGLLTARVVANRASQHDPAVMIRVDCADPQSELACNGDDIEDREPATSALAAVEVDGGWVNVLVDSFSPETTGPFRLTVTWTPQP